MIARGPSAGIVLPPYDATMLRFPFAWEGVTDVNADPGVPTATAKKVGSGATASYSRSYTKAEVTLDCATMKSTIIFK